MQPLAAAAHGIDASNRVQHELCGLDEPLEVLSMSTNPDGLNTWDDIRKMIHNEKVVDYCGPVQRP